MDPDLTVDNIQSCDNVDIVESVSEMKEKLRIDSHATLQEAIESRLVATRKRSRWLR